jgi:GT2 family glycosyltransferase
MTMRVSVLVPSYRRPDSLARCLTALARQGRRPDEVVVGARADDTATIAAATAAREDGLAVRVATTTTPGVVAAMQAALDACSGDVVALTDDDARPFPTWIAGLLAHFEAAPDVGGVGGRDWQPHERGATERVGMVQWFGRVIGNHHLGAGAARDVDVLKGANCAFRAPLLRAVGFDHRLRGTGAQLHWELGVCLPLRRAGWRLVYDPEVAVDHDVAPRHDADNLHRGVFTAAPLRDAVHNEAIALLEHGGLSVRLLYLPWALVIGTGEAPGPVQCARRLLRGDRHAGPRWRAALRGRVDALGTVLRTRRAIRVPRPAER